MQFRDRVYELLRQVPAGRVTTYRELARAAGRPRAYRTVGQIMGANRDIPKTPCHRVVRSDARLGGYREGVQNKIARLKSEGVQVGSGRIKNFEQVLYKFT